MSKLFQIQLEIAGRMGAGLTSAFSSVSAQMHSLGAQSAALRGNLKSLDAAYNGGKMSVDAYKQSQARLKAQLEQTQMAQSKLKAAQARYNESSQRAGEVRGKIIDTAITAAPMIAATNAAINFETAMNGVAKQVQGVRDDNLQLTPTYYTMQSNIMALSREMHILPTVAADTTAAAARMGVQGEEALNDFVRMSIQMGIAFEGSGDQIAEQMAKIANIRGIKIDTEAGREQIRDLADTVNYLDDQTTAKGPEIIETLQRISGTAAQSTFTNNDLAVLATTMIDLGKTPEIAATGLNALMNRIATAPSQAKSFQAALDSLGYSARELQASYMSDSKGTIFGLLEKIKTLDTAGQAEALTGLFGAEYQDDISALAAGMDKLKGNFDLLDDAARKGSMEKEFQAKMQTTQFAIEGVKQAAAETGISLTQAFLPSVQMVAGEFQHAAQSLLAFQQENPALTNAVMMSAAGLVGFRIAWLSVSFVMGQYKAQVEAIRLVMASQNAQWAIQRGRMLLSAAATGTATAAQWSLNAAMMANPVGIVIAGIAALVGIGYLLYQNWDTITAFMGSAWETAGNKVESVKASMVAGLDAGWTRIKSGAAAAGNAILNIPGAIAYGIGYAVGYLYTVPGKISVFVSETGAILMQLPEECMTAGAAFIAATESWASNAYTSTVTWISTTVSEGGAYLMNLPSTCAAAGAEFVAAAENWGSEAYNAVTNWIGQIPNAVSNYISSAWQNLKANFTVGVSAGSGGEIASNASGGIYGRGAFLTTFAEESPEAAIPLDGSARAVSLWHRAGEVLGVNGSGGGSVINVSFAPVINGGGPEVMQQVQEQQSKFMEQLQDTLHQNARVSYGV